MRVCLCRIDLKFLVLKLCQIFVISEKASPQKVYFKRKVRKINGINAEHFIADLQSRLNAKLNFEQLTSVNLQLEYYIKLFIQYWRTMLH